ncbi:hypothetical protein ABZ853_20585 [Streptomyces albidoflavus]
MPDRPENDLTPEPASTPRWWRAPALLGTAATLLLGAALTALAGRLLGDRFGAAPWWVALWPAAAAALLVAGAGSRRSLRLAAGLALVGAPLGVLAYVTGGQEQAPAELFLPAPEPLRPAAALLAAALCLVAAGLCALLSRVEPTWLPPAGTGSRRRRVRLLLAATAWGAVAGTVLTTATGYGALALEDARRPDPTTVDAVSETVPEGERGKGVEVTYGEYQRKNPYAKPGKVLWREELPGPAALTTCRLDDPPPATDERGRPLGDEAEDIITARSTLVSVESGKGWDAVVGHDVADGSERWRYTVRYDEAETGTSAGPPPGRLSQVGVSEMCSVHVVVDRTTLVTLSAHSGRVLREAGLPKLLASREHGWSFVTGETPGHRYTGEPRQQAAPHLVPLKRDRRVFLQSEGARVEMDTKNGSVISATHGGQSCVYMSSATDIEDNPWTGARFYTAPHLLTQSCRQRYVARYVAVDVAEGLEVNAGMSTEEYGSLQRAPASFHGLVTMMGCYESPLVTDFQLTTDYPEPGVAVAGRWCPDTKDQDRNLLISSASGTSVAQVVELPEDTPLPLRPVVRTPQGLDDFHILWLADGEVHGLNRSRKALEAEFIQTEGGRRYIEAKPRTLYAGPEPVQAVEVFARVQSDRRAPLFVYAVTRSGTLLALEQKESGAGEQATVAPELTPYAEVPKAAGACEGTRDITLDRAGLKLLTWCTTDRGSKVTAVSLDRIEGR